MDYLAFLRQFRIGTFPIFDVVISYIGIFLIAPILTKIFLLLHLNIPRSAWLWWTIPIGVLFHVIFSQDTPLMRMLAHPTQVWPAALVLIVMIAMGVRQVSVVGRK